MPNLTQENEKLLKRHQAKAPRELVQAYEQVRESLMDYADIQDEREVHKMFNSNVYGVVVNKVMESIDPVIEGLDYGDETAYICNENDDMVSMSVNELHKHNIRQLLENSGVEYRQNVNPHNLNGLTPFDGFVPHVIVRSYMPLVAKDLIPFETPTQPFIRIRHDRKYVVTKTGERYRRPDIYFDYEKADEILNSARGKEVTKDWFPKTETRSETPVPVKLTEFDLLQASGGNRQIGDALDLDVCIERVKIVVGEEEVEVRVKAYPDMTSIAPQRSVSVKIGPLKVGETTVTDRLYGEYDAARSTFNLTSLNGHITHVQFGGHLSNKNNTEYISYTSDSEVDQHPIAEGYTGNVPITIPDMQLYRQCASIDIIANAVNEITEMMTQFEDNHVLAKLQKEFKFYKEEQEAGRIPSFANFEDRPVVFVKEVDVAHDPSRLLKRYEIIQDQVNYALGRLVADVRDTMKAEPFKIKLFAHPNVASLFVGQNIDWKISEGTSVAEGVRSDYNRGIYTSDGNTFTIVTSQKYPESMGIRFVILPVNEQNFLSWKHYKASIIFDNNHRISEMQNVPAVHGYAKFQTQDYVPLQGQLTIKNYK